MKSPSLGKQIILLSIVPALVVSLILSVYFTYSEITHLSQMQKKYGELITRQVQTVANYSLSHHDIENLKSVLNTITDDDEVNYIKIVDLDNQEIFSTKPEPAEKQATSNFYSLLQNKQQKNKKNHKKNKNTQTNKNTKTKKKKKKKRKKNKKRESTTKRVKKKTKNTITNKKK